MELADHQGRNENQSHHSNSKDPEILGLPPLRGEKHQRNQAKADSETIADPAGGVLTDDR